MHHAPRSHHPENPDLDPARGCRQVARAGPRPVPELLRAAAGPRTAPSVRHATPVWRTRGASGHPCGRQRRRARGARAPRARRAPRSAMARSCSALANVRAAREERGGVGRSGVPLHVHAHRQRPQRGQGGPLPERQRRRGSRACRDTPAGITVSPAAHTILPLKPLWRSCCVPPWLCVPTSLGKEGVGAPVPMPGNQPSL